MNKKTISVFAPATVANVACGFDVLGFAIQQPGDIVELTLNTSEKVTIKQISGDGGRLPLVAEKNTAGVAVIEFLKYLNQIQGVEISIQKNLPLGSGLGSSAASSAAALVGINELLGNPLSKKELIPFAMEAERIACGAAHADNVAPSILGGLVLIRSYTPLDIIEIPTPSNLCCVVVNPHIELRTEDSRKVLPKEIPLQIAITQWGNLAALIAGFMKNDFDIISRSLQDVIAEPYRAPLIPGFSSVKQAALNLGALGCSISGSGPSIFALCNSENIANEVAKAMQQKFQEIGLESTAFISKINAEGAKVL
ncbi:MAG: homoserine kinase [Chitinophagales bacterium]|nr:homoserine kinase [Chitinophagales bacterium]MCO5281200.1 homoserine kinase [Chitinophagales bacterium]OJV25509.1 MAG: homoserine kinase [Bacteroidetes bacterium 37-13]HRP38095.1 homoserine kinase [Chitinophagales bacterium]